MPQRLLDDEERLAFHRQVLGEAVSQAVRMDALGAGMPPPVPAFPSHQVTSPWRFFERDDLDGPIVPKNDWGPLMKLTFIAVALMLASCVSTQATHPTTRTASTRAWTDLDKRDTCKKEILRLHPEVVKFEHGRNWVNKGTNTVFKADVVVMTQLGPKAKAANCTFWDDPNLSDDFWIY